VLDFMGIFDNLQKTLAFDLPDIEGVVHDLRVLRHRFTALMDRARSEYLPLAAGKKPDKVVQTVLRHFRDEESRHEFYRFVREASGIYGILSPDVFLRPYLDDYDTVVRMYCILREAYEPGIGVDRDFSQKTAELVRQCTKPGRIEPALAVYETYEERLRRIWQSGASDSEKVFSLRKSIAAAVARHGEEKEYLVSIGDRAEAVAKQHRERQGTSGRGRCAISSASRA